jgi:hypothetical protein
MIRRNTWYLLILLAGLIGVTFYFNNKNDLSEFESAATPEGELTFLFTAEDGLPSQIRVESADGGATELARNAGGAWALIHPDRVAADQGLAEAAASQVTSLRVLDEITLALDVLGLDQPAHVITIDFTSGEQHTLEVGSMTPTQSGYYVRLDKGQSVIVSLTSLDALLNLVTFPPYAETPTPSPQPVTETLTPEPEVTATP